MFIAVDVRLYDSLYALQGVQLAAVVIAIGLVTYLLLGKKRLTRGMKLWLWALAVIWAVCSCGLYAYNLHSYIRYDRPLFRQENSNKG